MEINIISITNKRPRWLEEAFNDYLNRFDSSMTVNFLTLKPLKKSKKINTHTLVEKEGKRIIKLLKTSDPTISLDRKGESWDTLKLKSELDECYAYSKTLNFLIGGTFGLSENCLKKSKFIFSLSKLTLPHAFVPLILIEQLYRVWSIGRKHPYHK